MRKINKRLAIVAAVAIVATTTGVAYAAWNVSGTGSASTKASSAEALTSIDTSGDVTGQLYPGATGDLVLKISNPNSFPITVTSVSLGAGKITSDKAGCEGDATGLSVALPSSVDIDVAAKGNTPHTFIGAVSMGNSSVDACQGATFSIPLAFSGISNATIAEANPAG